MTKIILKRKTNEEFSEIIIDEAKMYKYFNKNLHFFKYRSIENDEFKCIRLSMNWNNINFIINALIFHIDDTNMLSLILELSKFDYDSDFFFKMLYKDILFFNIFNNSSYIKFQTIEMCKFALKFDANFALLFKDEFLSYEFFLEMISVNSFLLEHIPDHLHTEELTKKAVMHCGLSLRFANYCYKTYEICKLAVLNNGDSAEFVPPRLMNSELAEIAINYNGWNIIRIPTRFINYNLVLTAVKQDGNIMNYIHNKFHSYEISLESVSNYSDAYLYLLNKYKFDETICKTAIRHNNSMIIHVKEFYKSKGLKW